MDLTAVSRMRLLARSGDARTIRTNAGIGLRELAAILKVAPSTLCRWETGAAVPRPALAIRWLRTLEPLEALGEAKAG